MPSLPDRIAIVQPLPGIGDMIWHVPHIRAVAAHWGGPVTLVAKPRSAADQIFAGDEWVTGVIWMDRNPELRRGEHDGAGGIGRLVRALRERRFRRAVLLHHSRTLALVLAAARIPERYGYGHGLQRLFLNRPPWLSKADLRLHPHAQATAWLKAAGIALADPEPRLAIPDRVREAVRRRLPPGRGPLVVMGVGSSEPYKQWGAARFIALARGLADVGWRRFAVAGGVAEAMLAEEIRAGIGQRAEAVAVIAWTLKELAALCAEAAFYVGNDTGVMNLAAACGIPAYGLFGATAPIAHSARIVPILPPGGVPDLRNGMRRITPNMVIEAIRAAEQSRVSPP
jgi:heptosyltransferase II